MNLNSLCGSQCMLVDGVDAVGSHTYTCTRQQTGSSGDVIRVHLVKWDLSCTMSGNEMGKRLQSSNPVVDSFHVATPWH